MVMEKNPVLADLLLFCFEKRMLSCSFLIWHLPIGALECDDAPVEDADQALVIHHPNEEPFSGIWKN